MNWTVDAAHMAVTNDAFFMHCLPVRRNMIVTRALMRRLREALAAAGGCRILCDGSNADDLTTFRPGQRAVRPSTQ